MSTIVINLYPSVLAVEHPDLYASLVFDGYYGNVPGCNPNLCYFASNALSLDFNAFEQQYWFGLNGLPADPLAQFTFINAAVPEPATAIMFSLALVLVMLPRKLLWRR